MKSNFAKFLVAGVVAMGMAGCNLGSSGPSGSATPAIRETLQTCEQISQAYLALEPTDTRAAAVALAKVLFAASSKSESNVVGCLQAKLNLNCDGEGHCSVALKY